MTRGAATQRTSADHAATMPGFRERHAEAGGVMSERLLEAAEVAALLSVPVSWVREQTRSGALPSIALGRYRRYDRGEVLAWVDSLRQGGGPQFRRHRPEVSA
jgi:excisionase family DNA binding protein